MNIDKNNILKNICYAELVFGRINKKLNSNFSKAEIEENIFEVITVTPIDGFERIGKNYYISNVDRNIKITVNSNTFRVITVDKISKV
ncbi:DUF3781 domain-containing protein [Paenimyroides tangerinum]|uniref:DUF3781 domain-containing protein n=1 Tax=Paenimyroides tangerinum TaxID=2488728 RepID=A0A3P3W5R3_9FLAO|nr:DUF3781 domain-containing protein [Paenimyroides tangerinum]RRJ89326.1 DUF3781 domain-containing protein [Paenimyroides tangerinum]